MSLAEAILVPIATAVWILTGLAIWDAIKHSTPEFHGLAGAR